MPPLSRRRGSPHRAPRPRTPTPARAECELAEDDGVVAFSAKGPKGTFTLFMAPAAFTSLRRLFQDFRVRGEEEEPQTLPLEETDLVLHRKAG
jgi:hypothetical protein